MDTIKRVFGAAVRTYSGSRNAALVEQLKRLSVLQLADIRMYLTSTGNDRLAKQLLRLDSVSGLLQPDADIIAEAMAAYGIDLPPAPMPPPLMGTPAQFTEGQFGPTAPPRPVADYGRPAEFDPGMFGASPPKPYSPGGKPSEFSQSQFGQIGSTPPPPPMPAPLSGRPAEFSQSQFGQMGETIPPPPPPWAPVAPWKYGFEAAFEREDEEDIIAVIAAISDAYTYVGWDKGAYTRDMRNRDLSYLSSVAQMDVSDAVKKEALAVSDAIRGAQTSYGGWTMTFIPSLSVAASESSPPSDVEVAHLFESFAVYKNRVSTPAEFYEVYGLAPSHQIIVQIIESKWAPGAMGRLTVSEALSRHGVPQDMYSMGDTVVFMYY